MWQTQIVPMARDGNFWYNARYMTKGVQVAAFTDGGLRMLASGEKGREAVLALPLSRFLVKMVQVPQGEDPVEYATPFVKALSPFPDEPLSVTCETVRETASGKVVIAAALPESAAEDVADALDEAKLNVVRVDILELGALRGMWADLDEGGDGAQAQKRRMVVLKSGEAASMVVLDGDMPCSIRAVAADGDMKRETMLSLLEAEDFNGPAALTGTVEREIDVDAALAGVAERSDEPDAMNALPESWRQVLEESRFKAKLLRNLAVAGGIWILAMAVLFGVPVAYGFMTDHVKSLSKAHATQYKAVADKKAKVKVVRQYSDHSRGALEILKAVSDRLPEGITLSSWEFTRDDGVRLRGDSDGSAPVYEFKDALVEMGGDDPVFKVVELGSMSSQKDGRQKFDLDCRYEEADE